MIPNPYDKRPAPTTVMLGVVALVSGMAALPLFVQRGALIGLIVAAVAVVCGALAVAGTRTP